MRLGRGWSITFLFVIFALVVFAPVAIAETAGGDAGGLTGWAALIMLGVGSLIAIPAVAMWGKTRGRQVGKAIAQLIPGEKIEPWICEFLEGLKEGLMATGSGGLPVSIGKTVDSTGKVTGMSLSVSAKRTF